MFRMLLHHTVSATDSHPLESHPPDPRPPFPPPATVADIPTMTFTEAILPTSTSTPPGPTLAATAGAVTGAIAAIFIAVVALICWRRRNKRMRKHRSRRGGNQEAYSVDTTTSPWDWWWHQVRDHGAPGEGPWVPVHRTSIPRCLNR